MSVYLYIYLSIDLFICICLFIYLSIFLYACVWRSIHFAKHQL